MNSDNSKQNSGLDQERLPAGEWLYQYNKEVFGPVTPAEVVERMFAGQITASTQVSQGSGEWKTISELPEWCPFLSQVNSELHAREIHGRAERIARRRRFYYRIDTVCVLIAMVVILFISTYRILDPNPSSRKSINAWAAKHVPLLGIEPSIEALGDTSISIENILIENAPELVAIGPSPLKKKSLSTIKSKKVDQGISQHPAPASLDKLTRVAIESKVYAQSNMNELKACLVQEIRRNADLPKKIALSFTIKNNGRIHNVQLDDVRLENGPLKRCFMRKLERLRFSPFEGQVQNVTIPFMWK